MISMQPETAQLLKNIAWGVLVLSMVSGLLYGTWHLVRLPAVTIDTVLVTGGETVSHTTIEAEVQKLLEGDYGNFIPRRFILTYPKEEIVSKSFFD